MEVTFTDKSEVEIPLSSGTYPPMEVLKGCVNQMMSIWAETIAPFDDLKSGLIFSAHKEINRWRQSFNKLASGTHYFIEIGIFDDKERFALEYEGTSVASEEMLKQLLPQLGDDAKIDYFLTGDAITSKKRTNATENCKIPHNESILALIDTTFWNSAKNCICFTESTLYWHNDDSDSKGNCAYSLKYSDFYKSNFAVDRNDISTHVGSIQTGVSLLKSKDIAIYLTCLGGILEVVGTLTGQFLIEDGKPMPKGVVSLFNAESGPAPDQGMRRIPDSVVIVDEEGRFTAEVPPGKYYLGGMPGAGDRGPGPPRPDEKVFWARNAKGELRVFVLKARVTLQGGAISGTLHSQADDAKEGAAKAKKTYVTIEGSVKDAQGKPVVGIHVVTRISLDSMRPDFISDPTGEDGGFRLIVPAGKARYLMARYLLPMGPPDSNSDVGFYGGNTPKLIKGKPGEVIKDANIVMAKVWEIMPNRKSGTPVAGSGPVDQPKTQLK